MRNSPDIVDKLDSKLPPEVNRRAFLGLTAMSMLPAAAGCLGDDDDDDDADEDALTWRQPWRPEPTWAAEFIAEGEGYWDDRGITSPNVQAGDGSPDTAMRIGTGEAELGTAEIISTVGGWGEGQESYVFGLNKQWNLLGLMWPEGRIEDHTDLEGSHVLLASPFAEAAWPVIPRELGLDADEITTEFVQEELTPGLLHGGTGDVVFGSLDTVGFLDAQLDEDMLAVPLSGPIADIAGFPFLCSKAWYDNKDQDEADEYLTAILEGYSEAFHWIALNPDETIDWIVDYEPDLAALERDELEIQMKWAITLKVGGPAQQEGVGYLDTNMIASSIEILAPVVADDPDSVPSPDEVIIEGPAEQAELTTFTDDEWDQVEDYISFELSLFDVDD